MAKKTTTKAVAKKEQNLPDARLEEFGGMLDETGVDASDILIPKILLMQPVSKFVADEKAAPGELVGSLDANVLAKKGKEVELVFFHRFKTWTNMKIVNGKEEFDSIVDFTPANANLPREEGDYKRYETLNYYVLNAADLKLESFLPYVVSFKSTNYKIGKKVETFRAKMQEFRKPLAFKTLLLGSEQQENDKGRFYINTVTEGRDTTDQELSKVKHWYDMIQNSRVKVDTSGEETNKSQADDGEGDF